jgi:hypothetical protein
VKQCSTCKGYFTLNLFYKRKDRKEGLSIQCKKCESITTSKYSNTEKGFLLRLFIRINSRTNHKRFRDLSEKEKNKHRCYVTKEEFFDLWEIHKLKYGYRCALTGDIIVHKTTTKEQTNKSNSISVDRLNPEIGYTKENIIFVSNKVNNMKNAVTKELCIAIVKAHEERGL